jgi:hypothetical protein
MNSKINYLDGNTAPGELGRIFAMDATAAEGLCAFCGATRRFAEAHVYLQGPGLVARCAACEHVMLRLVNALHHMRLDMLGMTYVRFDAPEVEASGR